MKLREYLSRKKLRRGKSKMLQKEMSCSINDSFVDYETEPRVIYSRDDLTINGVDISGVKMREKSRNTGRSAISQSLIDDLGSVTTNGHYYTIETGCQTALRTALSCQIDYDSDQHLVMYLDDRNDIEIDSQISHHKPVVERINATTNLHSDIKHQSTDSHYACDCSSDRLYYSLPSSQTSTHQLMSEVQYNSLPLSLTDSCYISSQTTSESHRKNLEKQRSRIRTNPWIPLPPSSNEFKKRESNNNINIKRAEPRLSKFIYEVEQIMRQQCNLEEVDTEREDECYDDTSAHSGSTLSLASTCSTATEIPVKQMTSNDVSPMRSPSEGYKSACGSLSSSCNIIADSESFNTDDIIDALSSSTVNNPSMSSSISSPPTFSDYSIGVAKVKDSTISKTPYPSMSDSMFGSTLSIKSEALQERVRKLCQSTSQLDEKIRLARLERSYIKNN